MNLKEQTDELRINFLQAYDLYSYAQKEFSRFEGKLVDESNIDQVNEAFARVQDTFKEVFDTLKFINTYAEFSKNALKSYQDFIDLLNKHGAEAVEKTH